MRTQLNKSFCGVWIIALCAMFITTAAVNAQAPQGKGYDGFKGIRTRNIFDPDRRGPRIESAPQQSAPRSRRDYLALTGTMVTSGKTLAFFTGSRSDYNRVIAVKDKIADYTVTSIDSAQVNLEYDGKPLSMEVGKQLSLDGSGTVSAISSNSTEAESAPSSSSSLPSTSTPGAAPSSPTSAPAGVPGDKSEILRRMMERRQQETSK
ncbi:hypothetical protein ACXR0O_23035 [Verrucomicrobiota bacterium sgz303538]